MRPLAGAERGRAGPYRLLAELGRGGMGRVCLAAGPDGRLVAVKLIGDQVSADEGFRERFRREVEASRRVSGAHTAAVLDADPDADTPWLASVFVPGPSLREAVHAGGPLPEASVRRLAAGLASALISIHGAGVVHRDLNPSNVLLTDDGVRVIDFGIARAADGPDAAELTRPGMLVGAAGYMAPEHVRGEPAGPAADVFALGCVLALACTGRAVFAGDTASQLLYQVVHAEPDLSGLPGPVRRLVAPCLDKDPARRPTPAQLREHVGTVEPSARPWPPGVRELSDRQRAEVARLLPGAAAHPTVAVPVVPGPVFPRGVASVGTDEAPALPARPGHDEPPARRSRLRLAFWLCAGATAVVLLATVGIGVGWVLATSGRPAGRAADHRAGGTPSPSPSPSASASPSPTLPVTGPIRGYGGTCLDVHDADTANRTPVQVYACNGTDAQQWTYGTDGTLRSLGKCLDVTDGDTVNGAKVQLYECNGTGAQQWTVRDGRVVNTPSGRCLDDTGWSTENGTQAQIWDCTGADNQRWDFGS